jgi:alanine-glyoxylate transaminase/serine-glyoxylate transaminase/serine-pyruvate transaminase
LQTPGPSNVPDRVLRALAAPTIDHRDPEFAQSTGKILKQPGAVFKTEQPVVIYPSSGTGAWKAALSSCLSPGDRILAFETWHFSILCRKMAVTSGSAGITWANSPGCDGGQAVFSRQRHLCSR